MTKASRFEEEPVLTPGEVAALFKVDSKTVIRWANARKLSTIRTPGGQRRFLEREVRQMLRESEEPREER